MTCPKCGAKPAGPFSTTDAPGNHPCGTEEVLVFLGLISDQCEEFAKAHPHLVADPARYMPGSAEEFRQKTVKNGELIPGGDE